MNERELIEKCLRAFQKIVDAREVPDFNPTTFFANVSNIAIAMKNEIERFLNP